MKTDTLHSLFSSYLVRGGESIVMQSFLAAWVVIEKPSFLGFNIWRIFELTLITFFVSSHGCSFLDNALTYVEYIEPH